MPGVGWRLALYNLVLLPGFPWFVIVLAVHALLDRRVRAGHACRLGLRLPPRPRRAAVWVHAVDAGEIKSVQRLVETILAAGHYEVYLSTSTAGGFKAAQKAWGSAVTLFYFPADFGFVIRRFLDVIRPTAVIIAEVEIWPNFLGLCHRRAIPVFLVNGRIGPWERAAYRRLRWFFVPFFRTYRALFAQSEGDRERMKEIGLPAEAIVVTGNLKCDASFRLDPARVAAIRRLLPAGRKVIVAGSTHAPEEHFMIQAVRLLSKESIFLVVAPRHVSRTGEIRKLSAERGWTAVLLSEALGRDSVVPCDLLVVDTVGDLPCFYQCADVVVMGGSFCPKVGGHNFLEPLHFAKPVVVGPWMQNFAEIERPFVAEGGLCKIGGFDDLRPALERLLHDEARGWTIGKIGYERLLACRGGSEVTYAAIFGTAGVMARPPE